MHAASGAALQGYENATLYFNSSPQWKDVIGYNEFTGGVELRKAPPYPHTQSAGSEPDDSFDTQACRWLETRSHMVFRSEVVHRTIDAIAEEHRFHPVRDYLESLPVWDKKSRLSTWLYDYCGVDPGSDERPSISGIMGRKFLISMIARVMQPGCKADHVLVLEGLTGIGKSSAARALVPEEKFFTDQLADMGSQNASMGVRGVWLVELGELDALSRVDEKTAKRFVSQQNERFRLPYGRRVMTFPRQCVFIGTTEKSDWIKSDSGRRWWPVMCGKTTERIDIDGIARDRDQMFAEALVAYRSGEKWYLDFQSEREAGQEQRMRFSEDVWTQKVLAAADAIEMYEDWMTVGMILDKLQIPIAQQNDLAEKRVGKVMRLNGWERKQKRTAPGRNPVWGYRRA